MLDPAYTTMDPSRLYVTTSGLAFEANVEADIMPILYDPAVMSTPWRDYNGVLVAAQADGTIVPVAVSSDMIDVSTGLPVGVTNVLASGVEAAGSWLQRLLSPSTLPAVPVPGGVASPLGNPMLLVLLGIGAYFLLRKR